MKPTIEQIKAWTLEVAREVGFEPMVRMEDEIAGIDEDEFMAALLVCTKAASWAREQALEEAAKVCADLTISGGDNASYCWGAGDCEKAIRALKEKANEHAPIPG